MQLLHFIKNSFLEFLFPRSVKVIELDSLSIEQILDTLPPADPINNDPLTIALFDYKHTTVKDLVWEIKYRGNKTIAKKLGIILYDHIVQELEDLRVFKPSIERAGVPILVPMPISNKRRFDRGWNQAELITKEIANHDNENKLKYAPKKLLKIRHTESQTKTSSKKKRLENLANSMTVQDTNAITDRFVVLVDDVTTTGATFVEARRALKNAGASKILCIAIAH